MKAKMHLVSISLIAATGLLLSACTIAISSEASAPSGTNGSFPSELNHELLNAEQLENYVCLLSQYIYTDEAISSDQMVDLAIYTYSNRPEAGFINEGEPLLISYDVLNEWCERLFGQSLNAEELELTDCSFNFYLSYDPINRQVSAMPFSDKTSCRGYRASSDTLQIDQKGDVATVSADILRIYGLGDSELSHCVTYTFRVENLDNGYQYYRLISVSQPPSQAGA